MTPGMLPNLSALGNVTTKYGGVTRYEKFHPGVDVANKKGTIIPAMTSGTVIAESLGHKPGENNYGNSVIIQDGKGGKHRYSHLLKTFARPGQRVQAGQPLAQMGDTGSAYSPDGGDASHLDYRIVNAYGKYVNPFTYVKKINNPNYGNATQ